MALYWNTVKLIIRLQQRTFAPQVRPWTPTGGLSSPGPLSYSLEWNFLSSLLTSYVGHNVQNSSKLNQKHLSLSFDFRFLTEKAGTQSFRDLTRQLTVNRATQENQVIHWTKAAVVGENHTSPPGGSKKQYTSVRKVNEPWIETRAVINSVTPMTTFLMRQSIVVSSLGRTEYQLLLMKISVRDRNVKINNVLASF